MSKKVVHHVCIQTDRYADSLDFYIRILGFELVKESMHFHGREFNTWLKLGAFMIELQTGKSAEMLNVWSSSNNGLVHICFLVEDVQQEYNRIIQLGYGNFKNKDGDEVYKVEDGFLFKVKAPEGTEIEFRDMPVKI